MAEIEASVASILDEYRVAINKGRAAGVEEGAEATLWRTVAVRDPQTGEILGHVHVDVLDFKIVDVQDKLSVARVAAPPVLIFNFSAPRKKLRVDTGDDEGDPSREVRISTGDRMTVRVRD